MSRVRPYRTPRTINGIPKPERTKKRRGAPRTVPPGMDERFMVRCTAEDLGRYRAEAARRGLARGRDSGVGALARIGLDLACSPECEMCLGAGRIRDEGGEYGIVSVRKCLDCNGTGCS